MSLLNQYQDDPSTNAGRGSNLTEDGHVECDASIMDANTGAFGAVGSVPGTYNSLLNGNFVPLFFLFFK